MEPTLKGISAAARAVRCSEATLRALDPILQPQRDSAGRRLFTDADIKKAREHLARPRRPVVGYVDTTGA